MDRILALDDESGQIIVEAGTRRLIEATVARGGKIHLAKDQVLRPEQFTRVYPGFRELLEVKRRLDLEGLFTSDRARRVGIDPALVAERERAQSAQAAEPGVERDVLVPQRPPAVRRAPANPADERVQRP